ncbi:unannotated protein [freshwater metagenome]|uniref:Unannotated protein n=1 Tax=freshwater metagenome TaxID=449393 RepID=A0A6J6U501_9ZZZZ|nr:hypothetical protein [Actinomycetota bacterium]
MADAREPDEGGSDLFDRWLSHRQESTGGTPRPRTYGVPRTGLAGEDSADAGVAPADDGTLHAPADEGEDGTLHAPADEAEDGTLHSAADATAAAPTVTAAHSAVVDPPGVGAASDGEAGDVEAGDGEEQQAHADAAATEPASPEPPARREPLGLDEFEPVVIASVRRQAETPVEKRSRLARFRRAGLEPDPADEEAADEGLPDEGLPDEGLPDEGLADEGLADERAAAEGPVASDEPAAPSGSDPIPRTPAPPNADPGRQQDAAAAVFAAFNPGAAPTPVAPPATRGPHSSTAPATTPTPPAAAAARGDAPPVVPTTPEPPRRAPRRPRPSLTSHLEAARTTLDRSVRGTPEERTPASPTTPTTAEPSAADQPAPDRTATPAPAPAAEAAPARSAYDELRAQREAAAPPQPDVLPPSIDFRPRTLARRVTSVLLLVGLVATGIAAWRAYDSRVETDIGLAAILGLATGVVWAVRAGSVPTRVGLHGGVLEVRSQAGRFVFEVTGAHTRLEVVGSPGRRGSRLLVHRRGLAPFAITPAMVDLRRLVEALRYYRPDL